MIKYKIPYYDLKNNSWRVELSNSAYSGDPINLNTTQGQGCTLSYNKASDDPFEPIITTTARFTVVKHNGGLIDVQELKNSGDKEWSVDVYKNNSLFWTGYLVPDGIQSAYMSMPYDVELNATDGLKMLQGVSYITNNWALPSGIIQRSFISHVRDILFNSGNLGKKLPIRWIGTLNQQQPSSILKDAFTECIYSPHGEGYTDGNGNQLSSYYILENYLRALQCRMYQSNGKWIIERIPDITSGTYSWKEIDTTYDPFTPPVLTTGTQTNIKNIGYGYDYPVDDGAYTINLPGLSKVTATYSQSKSENILPNGSFDSSLFQPFNWYASNGLVDVQQVDSINGRLGKSAEVTFSAGGSGSGTTENIALRDGVAGSENRLVIDTKTLYKRMSLGFTLMPQNGFPYDTSNGFIDWSSGPFRFLVSLTAYGTTNREFSLNENGFWIPKPIGGNFNGFSFSGATVGSNWVMTMHYNGNSIVGDWINYTLDGTEIVRAFCPQQYSNDLLGFLNYAGQYMVDNGGGKVVGWTVSGTPSDYTMTLSVQSGGSGHTHVASFGSSTTNRDGSISLLPSNPVKIGDVLQVNFDKFQGIKLPDFSDDAGHKYASINVFFYVNYGQRYTLDDAYITVDDNSEVYEYSYSSSKFTDTEDYELKISSSINGFFTSNVMSAYYNSQNEFNYIDSTGYVGTLTDITARTIIRHRSKSLEMFEGKLLEFDNVDFGTIYTVAGLDDKKMLPLSLSYNTELCEGDVSLVELNIGSESLSRKFYGSNDKPLSNQIIN